MYPFRIRYVLRTRYALRGKKGIYIISHANRSEHISNLLKQIYRIAVRRYFVKERELPFRVPNKTNMEEKT